ncbi:protein of unknown function [Shewanella benthica]|uniref:Uncharacterized protein n=1 Tax=Shewanella benthica TaxID=43661 RepID=A0A330MAC3_9GAMM|nr:hypothetical protein [Shewanella benthica]SQH78384.1 protein of unknown function [Shewanella benthica]
MSASLMLSSCGCKAHGIQGLINLFGIESPGLTASLAIAKYEEALLAEEK